MAAPLQVSPFATGEKTPSAPAGAAGRKRPVRTGIDIRRLGEFGVGTYTRNLLRALARVGPEEEYVLVGRPGQFEELGPLPSSFRQITYDHRYDAPLSHVSFRLLLRKLNLDVFHMPHRWVPYFMPGPYVATVHDIDLVLHPDERVAQRKRRIALHLLKHGLQQAACVITVSETTRQDLVKHVGLSPKRVRVAYNAIDEELALPVAGPERQRILDRYQLGDPFVLYAGRIRPHKNVPRLIEAFAVVKRELAENPKYGNLRLIIIGDELSSWPEVRHTVQRTRVENSVRFLGFVPLETLRVFYASARAFLFPSLYEGFGLPPLEAMAHGTPVVASSVSALPEAVGDAAVLVNPRNVFDIAHGLREVLVNEDLRTKLSRLGLERAQRFSWDASARTVLDVYRAVAAIP